MAGQRYSLIRSNVVRLPVVDLILNHSLVKTHGKYQQSAHSDVRSSEMLLLVPPRHIENHMIH